MTSLHPSSPVPSPQTAPRAASSALHRLLWRLHFWAGLATAPIVLFAACTGILYVFTPQVEAWRHGHLDRVAVGARRISLDDQVAAAQAARPGQALRHAVPGHAPGDTTQVYFKPPADHQHGQHEAPALHDHGLPMGSIAYVDPYSGRVVGTLAEMERFRTWSKKLHSTALQGDGWRWLLELAASWMLVMFATGIAMWWPRRAPGAKREWRAALSPRWGQGRATLRDLHALFAIVMGAVLCVLFVTGLTWSEYAGARFKDMQKALHQEGPRMPKSLRSSGAPGATPLGWQAILERVETAAPDVSVMLTPPATAQGVWRAENFDRGQPRARFAMALDAVSGEVLFQSGWEALPAVARATAVGIPFNRREFGVWNQAQLVAAALTLIFSVASGLAMWWLRRPRGAAAPAPALTRADLMAVPKRLRWTIAVSAAALSGALPVFGVSLLLFGLIEAARLLIQPAPATARAT
jgi:uncharacterized iron-regulated membrane protein